VKPKISVVTAVCNNVATVKDTILSVASQDYPYVEHIIIDGDSADGTLDIIHQYAGK